MYLMIENPGEAPVEGFTTLGVSTTRFADTKGTIGQFGTGSKHAVGLLLRSGIEPTIFAGNTRLEYFSKPKVVEETIKGETVRNEYGSVCVRIDNVDERELGFVLEHGTYDWTKESMALREFVANAIDRSVRETGDCKAAKIELVPDEQVGPRSGYTRIFLPGEPEVVKFFTELHRRFLHFTVGAEPQVMERSGQNLDGRETATIYRNGVFVRTIEDTTSPSLFDYNCGDDLRIDECRNVDDYRATHRATKMLAAAPVGTLSKMFTSLLAGEKTWEANHCSYDLGNYPADDQKKRWQEAWDAVAPKDAVLVRDPLLVDRIKRRGYLPVTVPMGWYTAMRDHGILSEKDVLTEAENEGKVEESPTLDVSEAVDELWHMLKSHSLTKGKDLPTVKCFTSMMDGGTQIMGYCMLGHNSYIAIHKDISEGKSFSLYQTVLEELCHYITQATDNSRDFQDFAFRVAATLHVAKCGIEVPA